MRRGAARSASSKSALLFFLVFFLKRIICAVKGRAIKREADWSSCVSDIRKLQAETGSKSVTHAVSQSSRTVHVSVLAARTRKVSGPQMFRNLGEFVRHFKGHFSK